VLVNGDFDRCLARHRPSSPPLRAVREARGLGLRDVANEAGIDPAHLSRVERGQANLSVEALLRLARVLGLRELVRLLTPYVGENGDG
jgi:transcriptional regulator with XRE-family HTH domain